MRMAITAVAAAGALSACSAGGAPAPGPSTSGNADETAVAVAFRDHNAALLAHDFAKACSFNDPALNQQLVASSGVDSCEDALTKIYTSPEAAATSDGIAKTAQITGITIDGDTARITWSVQAQGKQTTAETDMLRIGNDWRLTGRAE